LGSDTPTSIRATVKRKFFAGLFVLIPAVITFLVIRWFFNFVDSFLEPFYFNLLGYHFPGIGFISAVIIIFLVGVISTNVFGKRIIDSLERLLLKIPVLKGIYTSVKQLVEAFSPESKVSSFKKFVIVEYPRQGTFFIWISDKGLRNQSGERRPRNLPEGGVYPYKSYLFR